MVLYVLGELPADDALRVEEEYFADDACLVELNAVCAEMVEAYLHGEMPSAERLQFETRLEKLPYLNARVAAERALLNVLVTPPKTTAKDLAPASGWRSWLTLWPDWRLALAVAGLLVFSAGVWLVWQVRRTVVSPELAQQPPGSATPAPTVNQAVPVPQLSPQPTPPPAPPPATAPNPKELQTRAGVEIYRWPRLPVQRAASVLTLRLPAARLAAGAYSLRLGPTRTAAAATVEPVVYQFQVTIEVAKK
ncbi:MAG: hypothetical protein HYR56_20170 [Acidobacteria bacterium]|nr:hypothetical protein [Acidobacteriota bacterium]